jgi:hypothetical protein
MTPRWPDISVVFGCVRLCSVFCSVLFGFVRFCSGVFGFVRVCSGVFGCVRVCSGVFGPRSSRECSGQYIAEKTKNVFLGPFHFVSSRHVVIVIAATMPSILSPSDVMSKCLGYVGCIWTVESGNRLSLLGLLFFQVEQVFPYVSVSSSCNQKPEEKHKLHLVGRLWSQVGWALPKICSSSPLCFL